MTTDLNELANDLDQRAEARPGPVAFSMELDERVRHRLEILVAFARAVAHELGGTMLPSRRRGAADPEPDGLRRLRFQLELLSDHLVACKRGLDLFRSGAGGMDDRLETQEWWDLLRPLLKGAAGGRSQIGFVDNAQPGEVGAAFTRCTTLVVLAVAEQRPDADQIGLRLEGDARCLRLEVDLPAADTEKTNTEPLMLPSALERWLAAEPEATANGLRLELRPDAIEHAAA